MASVKCSERRESVRVPGSYPVCLWDARGRLIGRGKTANISERGAFVLLPAGRPVPLNGLIQIEMDLPRSPTHQRLSRRVRYTARVVRAQPMGQWQGVAVELQDKIA